MEPSEAPYIPDADRDWFTRLPEWFELLCSCGPYCSVRHAIREVAEEFAPEHRLFFYDEVVTDKMKLSHWCCKPLLMFSFFRAYLGIFEETPESLRPTLDWALMKFARMSVHNWGMAQVLSERSAQIVESAEFRLTTFEERDREKFEEAATNHLIIPGIFGLISPGSIDDALYMRATAREIALNLFQYLTLHEGPHGRAAVLHCNDPRSTELLWKVKQAVENKPRGDVGFSGLDGVMKTSRSFKTLQRQVILLKGKAAGHSFRKIAGQWQRNDVVKESYDVVENPHAKSTKLDQTATQVHREWKNLKERATAEE